MAESDVSVAPAEISPVHDQTRESALPSEAAAEEVAPSSTVKEVEEETKETHEEDVPAESKDAAAGEETGQGNQDLKRKLEVQEGTEKQLDETGNGEDGNEGEKEREGSEPKRQKTEIEEAERSGEVQEEEPPATENLEHDINTLAQTAEGDMQRDDFDADKTEAVDGSSETSRTIEVPNHRVGVLIGKAGDTIRNMQKLSGARIQIVKDAETAPDATTRAVELLGSVESINKAEQLIKDVLAEADAGRPPPLFSRGFNTSQSNASDVEIQVPNEKVGSIIGKGGQMIKDLQARSGAHILLLPTDSSDGEDVKERTVRISGNKQQIEAAKHMIFDVVNETARPHFQNRGGPGPRQSYGSRGPSSHGHSSQKQWGPPRHQSHSPGFNKYPNQRGRNYPQQFPQNPRQNYGKYPPARSGGRGAGGRGAGMGPSWDQRAPYGGNQPPQYGASSGHYGSQQQTPYGYGAPNPYQQNAVPPQQSFQPPPSQQYYGQQGTQAGYPQQTYNTMYPQGQAPAGTYGSGVTAQQQNPYAGQYGQYSQSAGADGYTQQYSQQYPQQPGQVATGYGQVAPAAYQGNVNYGYQGAVADPSMGYNAATSQAGYGQVMPATQAGYGQEQPVAQAGFDQGTGQPTAAGTTAQASGAPVAGGQWQG